MSPTHVLRLHPLSQAWVDAAIALDQKTLGGLWTRQGYQQEIERKNGLCLGVSTQYSTLIAMGFIWIVVDEAHLISMAVDPSWQRQGIGTLLLSQLLGLSRKKQCHRATLEVNRLNQRAISLYRKLNFQALGTRTDYYGKGQDAIIFWRNQLQSDEVRASLDQICCTSQKRLRRNDIQLMIDVK